MGLVISFLNAIYISFHWQSKPKDCIRKGFEHLSRLLWMNTCGSYLDFQRPFHDFSDSFTFWHSLGTPLPNYHSLWDIFYSSTVASNLGTGKKLQAVLLFIDNFLVDADENFTPCFWCCWLCPVALKKSYQGFCVDNSEDSWELCVLEFILVRIQRNKKYKLFLFSERGRLWQAEYCSIISCPFPAFAVPPTFLSVCLHHTFISDTFFAFFPGRATDSAGKPCRVLVLYLCYLPAASLPPPLPFISSYFLLLLLTQPWRGIGHGRSASSVTLILSLLLLSSASSHSFSFSPGLR